MRTEEANLTKGRRTHPSRRDFLGAAAAGVGAVAAGSVAACGPGGREADASAPGTNAPNAPGGC